MAVVLASLHLFHAARPLFKGLKKKTIQQKNDVIFLGRSAERDEARVEACEISADGEAGRCG